MRYHYQMKRCHFILLCLLLVGCGDRKSLPATGPLPTDPAGKLVVVATFSIVGEAVAEIGGDRIALTTLVGADRDVHGFEPSPDDAKAVADASILFASGLGLESWLPGMRSSTQSGARFIELSKGIAAREAGDAHAHHDHGHHHHDHGDYDPHVWHDVAHMIHQAERIRDALAEAAPDHAAEFATHAERRIRSLRELDEWVKARIATVPEASRKIVTGHDCFGYFADRYGVTVAGVAIDSFSTGASEPSAREMTRLVDTIKGSGVSAIFGENIHDNRIISRVAEAAGVELAPSLYTGALGPSGSPADSYLKLMRHNVNAMVTAMGGQ
jgi:zinc/manganese transport system substrate-binding protein